MRPREDSNLQDRDRSPTVYPLAYEGNTLESAISLCVGYKVSDLVVPDLRAISLPLHKPTPGSFRVSSQRRVLECYQQPIS